MLPELWIRAVSLDMECIAFKNQEAYQPLGFPACIEECTMKQFFFYFEGNILARPPKLYRSSRFVKLCQIDISPLQHMLFINAFSRLATSCSSCLLSLMLLMQLSNVIFSWLSKQSRSFWTESSRVT